jgi:hypothetical protein
MTGVPVYAGKEKYKASGINTRKDTEKQEKNTRRNENVTEVKAQRLTITLEEIRDDDTVPGGHVFRTTHTNWFEIEEDGGYDVFAFLSSIVVPLGRTFSCVVVTPPGKEKYNDALPEKLESQKT